MVKFFGLFLIMMSMELSAAIHTGTVSHIDMPRTRKELPLVFLSDGTVLKIKPEYKNDLNAFITAQRSGETLKLKVNKKRQILAVENLGVDRKEIADNFEPFVNYEPTVLATEADGKKLFDTLKRRANSYSQCYNRAHVWSYESKINQKVDSMKVFVFYTRKYIREYNFNWWFHVAPFTYVSAPEGRQERVLDRTFAKGPLSMKRWTDIFMRNKVECTSINKYSDYENHQDKAYCYLYRASMFYYQPLDLEALENTGKTKTDWVRWEVKNAYRNGFGWW